MTFSEMVNVVELCGYPGYEFSVKRDGRGEMFLQGFYVEPDVVSGIPEGQFTRRWFLSPEMTQSEIVRTVFKCVATSMEHRTREWFTYRTYAIFGPHFDVEALADLCREGKFEHRLPR